MKLTRTSYLVVLPILALTSCSSPNVGDWPEKNILLDNVPRSKLVSLSHSPRQSTVPFGQPPQFYVVLSNSSDVAIPVTGTWTNGVSLSSSIEVSLLRDDGLVVGYYSSLEIPPDRTIIRPGQILVLQCPAPTHLPSNMVYRRNPDALLPGCYRSFVYMTEWHEVPAGQGVYEASSGRWSLPGMVVSTPSSFTVTDDGSEDMVIIRNIQSGRGVRRSLELKLDVQGGTNVVLSAHNIGTMPLYLGPQWEFHWIDPEGVTTRSCWRLDGYIVVPPREFRWIGFMDVERLGFKRGKYTITGNYFNQKGDLLCTSPSVTVEKKEDDY